MTPSTDPIKVQTALQRLLTLLQVLDAEFPDLAYRVARGANVQYEALVDAYDAHCQGE